MFRGLHRLALLTAAVIGLGGCATNEAAVLETSLAGEATPASAKLIDEAQLQFSEGNFGKAVDAYAKTIETDPTNPDAWLGLAASYDQIGRFDQADKAYAKAQDLVGPTPSVLNNLGYSYLLRGNLERSRATLEAARQAEPGNPYILNNIEILNDRLAALGKRQAALD
jgi:Flp pilus assembly protein TadD